MKYLVTFLIGALGYGFLELLWRGYTHPTMLLTGGLCLIVIRLIVIKFKYLSVFKKSILSAFAITAIEITVGLIVNLKLGMKVWDYSSVPFNIGGQVCLLYSIYWFFLSVLLIKIMSFFINTDT